MKQGRKPKAVRTAPASVGAAVPRMPAGLSPSAKRAWKALISDLVAEGFLNPSDAPIIELAAVALGRARDARAAIEAEGMVVEGTRGRLVKNPHILIEQQCGIEARRCLEVLGIGPSARARVLANRPAGALSMSEFDRRFPKGRDVLAEMAELRDAKARGDFDGA